ncbi:MAG: hypothetical protein M3011_00105 [Actinomycetota bacterium]|nr:hypothetical protein [Actinomycetota bacterium]
MGIWVVILEAVATEGERVGLGPEPGALDDLAEELAGHYAVVSERPGAYETELWVEEGTAGGAVLAAQFLWQAAVRYLGLPAWEVVRAEARDAHALEIGIIDWPVPPAGPDEPKSDETAPPDLATLDPAPLDRPGRQARGNRSGGKRAAATTAVAKKAGPKKAVAKKAVAKKAVAKKSAATRPVTERARYPRR